MIDVSKIKIITSTLLSMLENMPEIIFIKDINLTYIGSSKSFADMAGAASTADIVGKTDFEIFPHSLAQRYNEDDKKLMSTGKPLKGYVEPLNSPDGGQRYSQTSKYILYDDDGNAIGMYGIGRDITREYEAKLQYEKELRVLFDLPPDALAAALVDVSGWRIVDMRCNSEKTGISPYRYSTVDEFIEFSANAVAEDDNVRDFLMSFSKNSIEELHNNGKRNLSFEYLRHFDDGTYGWVRDELHFLIDPVNGNLCVMITTRDIDAAKRAQNALLQAAEMDAMTGLLNRDATMKHIEQFLENEGLYSTHVLFMIDVDNFKMVNDTFGHQMGDTVLINIASKIRGVFRDSDIVGRVGGDEFFVFMKNADNPASVRRKAMELVEALQFVCAVHEKKVLLSGSIGISQYKGGDKTLDELYSEADGALYKAKLAGKNQFSFAYRESSVSLPVEPESTNMVHLSSLIENMDGIIFQIEVDDDIHIVYSSQNMSKIRNKSPKMPGEHTDNIFDMVIPEDIDDFRAAIFECAQTGTKLDHTYRVCNNGGEIEWRNMRGSRLPEICDGLNRLIAVASDITKQKQIEFSLREKNKIVEFAMKNTDVNFWFYDIKNKVCTLSENCKRVHGMDSDVIYNFPESVIESDYIRADCLPAVRGAYKKLKETGEWLELDVWYRKNDNSGWWCERINMTTVFDEYGNSELAIGLGKDITPMKEMENKYNIFQNYRKLAKRNTIASFRMNLSQNWCGDCISDNMFVLKMDFGTVDALFEHAYGRIFSKEELVIYKDTFSRQRLLDLFARGEVSPTLEYRYCIQEERVVWIKSTVEMMRNPITDDIEALFYSFDIDAEKNLQFVMNRLLDIDYEFIGTIEVRSGRLAVFGEKRAYRGKYERYNGGIYNEEMARTFREIIPEEYYDESLRSMNLEYIISELENTSIYTRAFPVKMHDNSQGRKQWRACYLNSSKSHILLTRIDITDIFNAERDILTGLYNRQAFYLKTRELIDANPSQKFAILRYDIDRFKAYNDANGTKAGDKLLAKIGRAIRNNSLPVKSVFGRIEGDHFSALIPLGYCDLKKWSFSLLSWLENVAQNSRVSFSMGVYEVSDPSVEVSLMCDRALLALRTVKQSYSGKVAFYDESMRRTLMEEQSLVDDMEKALAAEEFKVYFQPQINYSDGSLVGAEALVRWEHPKRGLIMPDKFIPLFEKNGFISRLDSYVWEKSCQYIRTWTDKFGGMPISVSVNVSRADIYDPALSNKLKALVGKYRLSPSCIKFEITESSYMDDPEQLIGVVKEIQKLGFVVEMDDFGAGYSSLNTLKDVPVDILKLDVRFLSKGAEDAARGGIILSSVIRMAHWLNLPVIAEGVENKTHADYLKSLSCIYMQGFYFGYPMPADDFEIMLSENKTNVIEKQLPMDKASMAAFYDPSSIEAIISDNFVGGSAILEYCEGNGEIIRANDNFYEQLNTTRQDYLHKQKRTFDRFNEQNRKMYVDMLEEAIRTGKEAECEIKSLPQKEGDMPLWTHNRVRLLAKNGDSFIFFLSVQNISRFKTD